MNQLLSLAWKEWREAQAYLLIGLGVFLGLPIIGGIEEVLRASHRFEIESIIWVDALGGILAIFIAVGCTCRDLSGRVEDFWRSRPVSVLRWMLTKYLVGLAVVLIVCIVPMLAERLVDRYEEIQSDYLFFLFNWIAVYGIAFAAGCLFRRTAHAAMFALAAMLLVLCLPLILPPLAWMNVTNLENVSGTQFWKSPQFHFLLVMLALAAMGAAVGVAAVRRSWQIESGRKMIYGSIAGALLIVLASASYQLGTNLPVIQQLQLSGADKIAWYIHVKGKSVEVESGHFELGSDGKYNAVNSFHKFELTETGLKPAGDIDGRSFVGEQYWDARGVGFQQQRRDAVLPDGSFVNYQAETDDDKDTGPLKLFLWHSPCPDPVGAQSVADVKLWDLDHNQNNSVITYAWGDKLYVFGTGRDLSKDNPEVDEFFDSVTANRLATIDISDPLKPRVLSIQPFSYRFVYFSGNSLNYLSDRSSDGKLLIQLPDLPGMPARQRLRLAMYFLQSGSASEDDTFCFSQSNGVTGLHLSNLDDHVATFTYLGICRPGLLENVFGARHSWQHLQMKNGLIYDSEDFFREGEFARGSFLRPMVRVIETRGPHPMRIVGHFAAPDLRIIVPLDDGRTLLGGDRLWLVGPPTGR